ncbi:MAG: TolC family protein [Acidobacteria bacterium]|nr:TolC family protein [Acidobacteriota bacterium]
MERKTAAIVGALAIMMLSLGRPACADTGRVLTLQTALKLASRGPAVREAAAAIDRAAALQRQASSARHLQLELDANDRFLASSPGYVIPRGSLGNPVALGLIGGERHVWTASIEVRQLLWDAGRTKNLLEAAGRAREAARARHRAVERAVELGTLKAYAAVCVTGDLIDVAKKAVAEYEALLDQVTALVANEQLPMADQLQARAALEAARVKLIDAKAQHAKALAMLEELAGVPVTAVAPMPLPAQADAGLSADTWIARALKRRQELTALERRESALKARAEAARADKRPALVAIAGAQRVDDEYQLHKNNASVAVALRIPLLDGGLASSRAAQLSCEARAAGARLEEVRRRIRREVRDAFTDVAAARQRLEAARAGRTAANEALRMARLRYKENLITNRELLDAEADAVEARRSVVMARTQLVTAQLALENLAGGDLLAQVGTQHTTTEGTSDD